MVQNCSGLVANFGRRGHDGLNLREVADTVPGYEAAGWCGICARPERGAARSTSPKCRI
jgi:hypothetical protein